MTALQIWQWDIFRVREEVGGDGNHQLKGVKGVCMAQNW